MPPPAVTPHGPSTPGEWIVSLLLSSVVFGCFFAVVFVDYEPHKLIALLFPLFWMLLLPWHEAGHALVAFLVGWHVGRVVIGWGRPRLRFRCGDAVVEVRTLPLEGFVQTVPTTLDLPRLKSVLIFAAGVGAELLILGAILAAFGPDALLSLSDSYPVIVAQSLALAILGSAFVNLTPHYSFGDSGEPLASDGLGIIQSMLAPLCHFEMLMQFRYDENTDRWEPQAGE